MEGNDIEKSETTNTGEDNITDEKKETLGNTKDDNKDAKDEVEEVVEETREEKNEPESLQDIQTEVSKQLTENDRLVLYEKGVRYFDYRVSLLLSVHLRYSTF
jgi:hypothetical protein